MAAVEITISGMLYDKTSRTTQNVVVIGEATLTGLGVGGGPLPGGGGKPPYPDIGLPGVDVGWSGGVVRPPHERPPYPDHTLPGVDVGWSGGVVPVPPGAPNVPPPGSPPMHVGGTQPVNPMVPPPAVIIDYPGVGKVVVPLPTADTPPPTPPAAAPAKK